MKLPTLNLSVYADVLRISAARRFDVACVLIRCLQYIFTIGIISMMTLAGHSSFTAGSVAATACLATFLISPPMGRLVDTYGQHAVVPWQCAIACIGCLLMCGTVILGLPLWICYAGAVIVGAVPNGPSLARARWTYLVETGKFGAEALSIRTVYSYEGVLEDIVFTLSPALAVALSAAIHPAAGVLFGGVCLVAGTVLLLTCRNTQPEPGWHATEDAGAANEELSAKERMLNAPDSPWVLHPERSVFRLSPTIRTLFVCMVLVGVFYGAFDNATVSYCESIGQATLASPVVMIDGIISAVAGMLFGTLVLKSAPSRQLLVTALLIGFGYFTNIFVCNVFTMFLLTAFAAPFYAPFFITVNTVCEHAIPSNRITEGIAWVGAGATLGFAIGPTLGGAVIDVFGALAGFKVTGFAAIIIPVVIFLNMRTLAREIDHVHD